MLRAGLERLSRPAPGRFRDTGITHVHVKTLHGKRAVSTVGSEELLLQDIYWNGCIYIVSCVVVRACLVICHLAKHL